MLFEKIPIKWMEKKLIKYENKEKFASFWIDQLFDYNFGRKTKKSTNKPPPTAIPSAPAPFASLLLTFFTEPSPAATLPILGQITTALVNTLIYST